MVSAILTSSGWGNNMSAPEENGLRGVKCVVKTTGVGGERGYEGAKKITGRTRHLLVDTLTRLARHVFENTTSGQVTLSAYPSHDQVKAYFEIRNDSPARRDSDRIRATERVLNGASESVMRMGGEVSLYSTQSGDSRVAFWLPQWV